MAKHLFLLAVGALALTACTSEDVVEDVATTRNLIQFENVVNKPSRAATDLTTSTLNQFNVFGFYTMPETPTHAHAVFNHVPVTNSTGSWTYDAQYKRYWIPGATYYFYAYSCGSSALGEGLGSFSVDMENGDMDASQRTLKITDYVCNYQHQHDLLFASQTGYLAGATNGAVAFQFKHILSKIMARFTNTFSNEYDVIIKKVTVNNVYDNGDYDFSTGWQDVNRSAGSPLVYLINPDGDGNTDKDSPIQVSNKTVTENGKEVQMHGDSKAAYVIPNNYTNSSSDLVYLNFTIDVVYKNQDGSQVDYVIKDKQLKATLNPDWKEGYSYIYNIDVNASTINLGEISFTVTTITNWDTTDQDQTALIDNPGTETGNN